MGTFLVKATIAVMGSVIAAGMYRFGRARALGAGPRSSIATPRHVVAMPTKIDRKIMTNRGRRCKALLALGFFKWWGSLGRARGPCVSAFRAGSAQRKGTDGPK